VFIRSGSPYKYSIKKHYLVLNIADDSFLLFGKATLRMVMRNNKRPKLLSSRFLFFVLTIKYCNAKYDTILVLHSKPKEESVFIFIFIFNFIISHYHYFNNFKLANKKTYHITSHRITSHHILTVFVVTFGFPQSSQNQIAQTATATIRLLLR